MASIDVEKLLEYPMEVKKFWNKFSAGSGRHTMILGRVEDGDDLLCSEDIRRGSGWSTVSYTFAYHCKRGESIKAVVAYDCWDDDTGGDAEVKNGGVGQDKVEIKVTSKALRGFHFKFYVYGTK